MKEREARRIVAQRCGGRCERCGAPEYTIHHRRKKSQGGPWTPSNLLAVCGHGTAGCHGHIEANPTWAHDRGLWLRAGESPAETPVMLWGRPVVLTDDGRYLDCLETA